MAKKLSKFGSAFNAARDAKKSEFDFGGKKYNTKMKSGGKKAGGSLPATTSVMPKSRADAVTSKAKESSFSGLSNVAKTYKPTAAPKRTPTKLVTRTPAQRDIAKSKAYITNHTEKKKDTKGESFSSAMKKVSNSIKMGSKK